jgi:hypothetical protein
LKPCLKIWIACLAVSLSALPALSQFTAANVAHIPPPDNQDFGSIAVADFNGDGYPDILSTTVQVSTQLHGVQVQFGNGRGGFYPGPFFSTLCCNGYPNPITGDFNGDGKQDLILYQYTYNDGTWIYSYYLFFGNGDGTFQAPVDISAFAGEGLVAADLRHNGRLDLVSLEGYALSNGDGTFQPRVSVLPSGVHFEGNPPGAAVGDLGNGHNDLIFLADDANGPAIIVAMGNGDGTFQPATVQEIPLLKDEQVFDLIGGHFTPDGRLGVAIMSWTGFASSDTTVWMSVLPGKGDGTFANRANIRIADYSSGPTQDFVPWNFVAVDLNGDGVDEIALLYTSEKESSIKDGNGVLIASLDGNGGAKLSFNSTE